MQKFLNRSQIAKRFSFVILILTSLILLIKPAMKLVYPIKYEKEIREISDYFGLDPYLVAGIISTESRFDEEAVSGKGAKGLMQIKDTTKKWCVENFEVPFFDNDAVLNISIGCTYFRYLMDKYDSNVTTSLAAYNAGEGNVSKWLKLENSKDYTLSKIPFHETENYVETVETRMKIYRFLYSKKAG